MFNMLVLDDEKYAVWGITRGICWDDLPLAGIYEAFSISEAVALAEKNEIAVAVCDIEMPEGSGIDFIRWLGENSPNTEKILLTGHAEFQYAIDAVRYGALDYLLKPTDSDNIKNAVAKALKKAAAKAEGLEYIEAYNKYKRLYEQQFPILTERFWQDLLDGRVVAREAGDALQKYLTLYRISVGPDQKILPMLLAIDYLKEETNDGRDEVMLFAVRNIAAEIFLEGFEGCVFQNHDGNNMALVYPAKDFEGIAAERCARLINSCGEYLGFGLSCFIGEPAVPAGLRKEYLALLDMRENNLTDYNAVLFRKNARPRSADETPACLPDISEWLALFETGNKEALIGKALEFIHRIESGKAASDAGDMVRSGIMYMLHYGMMQNGLRLSDVPGFKNLSLERFGGRLGRWAKSSIDSCMDYIAKNGGNLSQNIKKAKDFIEAHYREDITRDDIARHVYLNPMYLSRLFKKETGTLLSDYILNRRIEAARRLLTETNKNISTIAESVGYANLSYFAKAFRNVLGVTPQEYRKNMKQ